MNRVLMVAYHFPPLAGSSGVQRTLRFCQDLPAFGWLPAVLGAHPRAFDKQSDDLLQSIPDAVDVQRAFALDASRHLSVAKRYPGWIARPDRWVSWLIGAIPTGLRMIRQQRPEVIWSTYPIPTAHLIGYWLSRFSGVPWVADFRDPMAHAGYPADPATWNSFLRVEQKVFAQAARMVFTTPGAARLYRERYPAQAERIRIIENGYDEASFELSASTAKPAALHVGKFTLLHSGIVYPQWRDPTALFAILRRLLDTGLINRANFCLRFRAAEHTNFLSDLISTHGLRDMVEILPAIDYRLALAEMCAADGLLVLQSEDCNDQIPAKVYEYLRAGKPILGLCGSAGDTWDVLRRAGCLHLAPLESAPDINLAMTAFLAAAHNGAPTLPDVDFVETVSRRSRASALAELLDEIRLEHASHTRTTR